MSYAMELKQTRCGSFCEFQKIVSYCFDCPALLCAPCKVSMHNISETKNHQIIEIKNENLLWGDQETILNILGDFELTSKIFIEVSRVLVEKPKPIGPKPKIKLPEELNGQWKCKFCTVDNPSTANRCGTCNKFPKDIGISYKMKLDTFNTEMLPKFKDLDNKHQNNLDMSVEHIINCYTQTKSQNLPILSWYRDYYPNFKSFNVVHKIIEENGFGITSAYLELQYYVAVKRENEMLLSYITKSDMKGKLISYPDLLEPLQINSINKIDDNMINKQITDQEVWNTITKIDCYTQKDIRMLITELDLNSQEQIIILRAFINDNELGAYLKTSYQERRVKLIHVRQAVMENIEISCATNFLQNNCELCCEDYPMPEMRGLITCLHEFCKNCALNWLKEIIAINYPCKWNCPFCAEEKYLQIDKNLYYSQLRSILSENSTLLEVFESKLLTEQLMKSKNFHWCANEQCTNGFEAEGATKIRCTHCESYMCVKCNRLWHEKHEDKTCQDFELWMLKHDALSDLLRNIGIECPQCGMRYAVAPGGCLHFDCKACGVKFCGGCYQLFVDRCGKPKCQMSSFHGHHPRNCLYFLRDYGPVDLENMLKEYDYPKLEGKPEQLCQFIITVEQSMKDVPCNKDVHNTTGMCETHYKEYLVQFINRYKIDPADFVNSDSLNLMLFQMVLDRLQPLKNETDDVFKERLKKHVKENCLFYIPKSLMEEDD